MSRYLHVIMKATGFRDSNDNFWRKVRNSKRPEFPYFHLKTETDPFPVLAVLSTISVAEKYLISYPDDLGISFFRNVGIHLTNNTFSHSLTLQSWKMSPVSEILFSFGNIT